MSHDVTRPTPHTPVAAYSVEQTAQALSCSESHVRREIDRGRIRAFRVGRLVRVSRAELERLTSEG